MLFFEYILSELVVIYYLNDYKYGKIGVNQSCQLYTNDLGYFVFEIQLLENSSILTKLF